MYLPLVFVGPGGVTEEARDSGLYLAYGICKGTPALLRNSLRKLPLAYRQVLRDVIEDLRAIMRRANRPASGSMGSFDGVTNIFAIAFAHLADDTVLGIADIAAITGVWTNLFAFDEHFRRAIDRRQCSSQAIFAVELPRRVSVCLLVIVPRGD